MVKTRLQTDPGRYTGLTEGVTTIAKEVSRMLGAETCAIVLNVLLFSLFHGGQQEDDLPPTCLFHARFNASLSAVFCVSMFVEKSYLVLSPRQSRSRGPSYWPLANQACGAWAPALEPRG